MSISKKHAARKELKLLAQVAEEVYKEELISYLEYSYVVSANIIKKRRSALLTILMTKGEDVALEILDKLRKLKVDLKGHFTQMEKISDTDIKQKDDNVVTNTPLTMDLVMLRIYSFLNLKDVKNCRRVCLMWRKFAEIVLRKRGKIILHPNKLRPKDFVAINKKVHSEHPFKAFTLDGEIWDSKEMEIFFGEYGKVINHLEIITLSKNPTKRPIVQGVLSDTFLSNFRNFGLEKYLHPEHLTFLNLHNGGKSGSGMISRSDGHRKPEFSLAEFLSLKEIKMKDIRIHVPSSIEKKNRLRPLKINLECLDICKNGIFLQEYCYNELFDLSGAEEIVIWNYDRTHATRIGSFQTETIVILDFGEMESLNAKLVDLHSRRSNIEVKNWKLPQSSDIGLLKLTCINNHHSQKINAKVKSVVLVSLDYGDLTCLPESIEILELRNCDWERDDKNENFAQQEEPVNLPSLKSLTLWGIYDVSFLHRFHSCSNLNYLEIHYGRRVDLAWIPASVATLKINKTKFKGENVKSFNKVVAGVYQWEKIKDTLPLLKASVLVLELCGIPLRYRSSRKYMEEHVEETSNYIGHVLNLLLENSSEKIYVGPFFWELFNSNLSQKLSKCIDKNSSYYIFEDKKGTAICKEEFTSVIQ